MVDTILGNKQEFPLVIREDREEVAIVEIRRHEALNALNSAVISQLGMIFNELKADTKIRGVVLTGSGDRAFVAGADIKEIAGLKTPAEGMAFSIRGQEVFNLIENLGKPVVCAMNGLALGGGNELTMACSARIAKKGMKVLAGQPEPKLGIIPGFGGTQRLPRIVGFDKAWYLLRTGALISSEEAKQIGLISEEIGGITSNGDIISAGITFVRKIIRREISLSPISRARIRVPESLPEVNIGNLSRKIDEILVKAVIEGAKMALEDGLKYEAKCFGECWQTKDMRIGIETFIQYGPKKEAPFVHS